MNKKPILRMKLPIRCWMLGHNDNGMLYTQAGNPDKQVKIWNGYYCTRCGMITQHTNYARKKDFLYGIV